MRVGGGEGQAVGIEGGWWEGVARFDVRLLQLLLGRAYTLSLTQGRHAAAKAWGRVSACAGALG